MKKQTRTPAKKSSTGRRQVLQKRRQGNIHWLIISAICVAIFACLIGVGVANAATSSSPGQGQKDQTLQHLIDAGRTHIAPKASGQYQAQVAQPAPARQSGIIPMHQGPFLASIFTVRNFWQGPVGTNWVLAYAGAKMQSDGTVGPGAIVLYTETANAQGGFDLHPLGTFLAPTGTTALTLTAVNGTLLQARSESGAHFTFNLVTHQFHQS